MNTPAAVTPAVTPPVVPENIDFSSLSDVTTSMTDVYGETSRDQQNSVLLAALGIQNTGTFPVDAPLVAVINNLSDPSIRVRNSDGLTASGQPYFDFSSLIGSDTLAPGKSTTSRTLTFYDPNGIQFTYNLQILAKLDQPPTVTSQPNTEAIAGLPYSYQATATDPDDHTLTYSLLTAPAGMTVDPNTGLITWSPQQSDLGNQAVLLQIADGHGGVIQQPFTVSTIVAPPNRPPLFTSTPIVQANVDTAYTYQATALDTDGDPLTFSVVSGPMGLTIDGSSGLVQWTPTADELGTNAVSLQVSDGRGGTATQAYSILVQQAPGNLPPFIVSTPVTTATLGQSYQYPVKAIDADNDQLTYSLTTAPTGMAIDPASGLITWPPPREADDAVQLSGAGYVITPNLESFFPTSTVTLELWFNATGPGVIVDELGQNVINAGFNDSQLEILSTGEVRARVWDLPSVSLGVATFNTWHYVALRYEGSSATLDGFLDGVKSATAAHGARIAPSPQYYALGAADGQNLGSGAFFTGQINEFRVWNTARSDSEITDNMNQALTGTEAGLVAYYRLDDGVGTLASDSTGHGNTATLVAAGSGGTGLPTWVTSKAPNPQVTVRVDDGRGSFDTQSYSVVTSADQTGEIEGTKFNDLNGDGKRGLIGNTAPPVPLSNLPGGADPYLAGLPSGTTADSGDTAPAQSPVLVTGTPIIPGNSLMFTTLTGLVNNTGPDGGGFTNHPAGILNGISNIVAPVNSLVGVFLGPNAPDASLTPATLDFSPSGNVPGGVDYTTLSPQLQQVFFIGDGRTSTGQVQQIVVPAGASRLFLGTMAPSGWHNNSGSFGVDVTPFDPTSGPSPIALTAISTKFSSLIHVDYYEPDNTLIASLNYPGGQPNNFDEIKADGSHVQFSKVSGFSDEVYIAIARSSDLGGFKPGDLFVGNGQDGQIARITNNGQKVINPWVTLPGSGNGVFRGYLTFDRTGVFGGDLIAETDQGEVWAINAAGQATEIGDTHSFLEGAEVIPNDPARYGPLAGTVLATDEQTSGFYSITPAGQVTFYNIGVGSLEDAHVIPANQNFFGADYGSGRVLGIPSQELAPMAGDILFTQEIGGGLFRMYWDGSAFQMEPIDYASGSTTAAQWEGSNFAPAGIAPIPPVPLEPGLPGWTIYLDLNHDGKLDPGDPTAVTDSLGHYTFANLALEQFTKPCAVAIMSIDVTVALV
jgi:hypothetical protein